MKYSFFFSALLVCIISTNLWGQDQKARITGKVTDGLTDQAVELVTVYVEGTSFVTETAQNGRYSLDVPAEQAFTLVFSRIGYKATSKTIQPMPVRSQRQIDVVLAPSDSDIEVIVKESKLEEAGMIKEEVSELKLLPTTTGNFESVLPHIALGTSSGTGGELSSQYNVRGGNYDENLVYVNDFQIYRPQLIRAGQQEGLTFPNIDLIRDLSFSSGGFEARYGDKLSSVLDIKYKRPDSLKASVGGSFLGGSAHIEGSFDVGKSSYKKLRYLVGARYKTTRYLLGSLDITGEYIPNFADIQTYITYDLNRNWQLGFLGNYNRSVYRFKPQERSTALGLINFALELRSVFEGQETDDFTTSMAGVSATYIPDRDRNPYFLKFLASTFQSLENERFDIIGYYSLRQIESDLGSDNFGEVLAELGTGIQHQYVRNFLSINVTNFEHKGGIELQVDHDEDEKTSTHFVQWSAKIQHEYIDDYVNEWERLDSAGYSLPFNPESVEVFNVLKRPDITQRSIRMSAFFQDTYTFRQESRYELKLSAGLRASYWDLNKELLLQPRAQLLYKPLSGKTDISYRLAAGLYHQPPFYRELRAPDGTLNQDLKAQKSAHLVGGFTWDFYIGKANPKKFRFIAEAYYKQLWDLVSYEIENVRIRYSGLNDATGYVMGLDMRMNGEFVPGAESWINLSFLRARENLTNVQHLRREVGEEEAQEVEDVPRPTDQLMTVSIFFQDHLPKNENFRMHLNLTVGTGLPFGLQGNNRIYRNTYRFPAYHRVDIGFSLRLWDRERLAEKPRHPLRFTERSWISLEIFNLMEVQNQAGNTWIKTVFDQQYAIPNYLTSRRINLRFRMEF
ncbi:MAG: TonB-dependent receptor [Saprospiraceae bacterium]|nr:TonB-dependent receptor [Saprospiraceae bacterium]